MALFNYAAKEVTLKIVYYGPGLSGKTINLRYLHSAFDSEKTGKLISLATETDRTLFFDFLPVELGKIKDFSVRFQLYTVPGQIKYNLTRKAVLKGADAVVFVADSQREGREANIESFTNMKENLLSNNINPDNIALVLQYNKRDLTNILSIAELNNDLNSKGYIYIEAEAINGKGVEETFQSATKLLIKDLSIRYKFEIQPAAPPEEILPSLSEEAIERQPFREETVLTQETALSSLSQEPPEATVAEEPAQSHQFQQEQVFPEKYAEESQMPKTEEPLQYLSEPPGRMTESIKENTDMLAGIKSVISELLEELKKSREDQREILTILREIQINETIERIKEKEKKGWFTK
jgi:signal recognition particle receptor subunit beta